MVTVEVDLSTGFLAGPLCPRAEVHRIQMPADSVPSVICPIHNPAGLTEIGAGTVPDVIGLDIAGAVEKLEAAGYSVAADWDEPGPLFPGTVYAQDPQESVAAQAGATVRLTVAGPEPGTVTPFVLGLLRDDALALLNAAGLQVEVITRAESDPEDASARTGAVWSQQPASGAPLTGNVTIWVNPRCTRPSGC